MKMLERLAFSLRSHLTPVKTIAIYFSFHMCLISGSAPLAAELVVASLLTLVVERIAQTAVNSWGIKGQRTQGDFCFNSSTLLWSRHDFDMVTLKILPYQLAGSECISNSEYCLNSILSHNMSIMQPNKPWHSHFIVQLLFFALLYTEAAYLMHSAFSTLHSIVPHILLTPAIYQIPSHLSSFPLNKTLLSCGSHFHILITIWGWRVKEVCLSSMPYMLMTIL